jgi:hypothetical protein
MFRADPLAGDGERAAPLRTGACDVRHGAQRGLDCELFDRTMKDYAQPIAARQLVDVVAYLRNPRVQSERAPQPGQ